MPGVLIRVLKIRRVGPNIKILTRHNEDIDMIASGNIIACTFHPELTDNTEVHGYFIDNFIK